MSEVSVAKNGALTIPKMTVRARETMTPLNLHIAGAVLLVLLNVYLLLHVFFVWRATKVNDAAALQQQMLQRKTADIAAQPLRGLDTKLKAATEDADKFEKTRLPFAQSEVSAELGAQAKKQGVRLISVQYAFAPVLAGTEHELTEVRMDAALSGDYRPLAHLVNALERDKIFFWITSMALTGQQSGAVNLHLRVTSYLRPAAAGELAKMVTVENADVTDAANSAEIAPAATKPVNRAQGTVVVPRPRWIPGMPVQRNAGPVAGRPNSALPGGPR